LRTTLRTSVKSVRAHLTAGAKDEAQVALKSAIKHLDKAVTKGILRRRTASRAISRLTIAVNRLSE
jgi:small subunit ribosomal protein S20